MVVICSCSCADFLISAAVAEFKGPDVFGVVRLAQVSMELARIEANFSGLSPGKHGWSINEYGDLTQGAASTGKIFNPTAEATADQVCSPILPSKFARSNDPFSHCEHIVWGMMTGCFCFCFIFSVNKA